MRVQVNQEKMSEKRGEIQGILDLVRVMGFGVLLCIKKQHRLRTSSLTICQILV